MSLINCYECETPVSEHADRCALCRAPIEAEPIRSRPLVSWPLVTLVTLGVALASILTGCGDSATCAEETIQQRVDRNSIFTEIQRDRLRELRNDGFDCLITSTTESSDLYTCTRCI